MLFPSTQKKNKYCITGSSDSSTYHCEPCVKFIHVGVHSTLGISRVVTHVKLSWYKDENFRAKYQCAIWQRLLCNLSEFHNCQLPVAESPCIGETTGGIKTGRTWAMLFLLHQRHCWGQGDVYSVCCCCFLSQFCSCLLFLLSEALRFQPLAYSTLQWGFSSPKILLTFWRARVSLLWRRPVDSQWATMWSAIPVTKEGNQ